MECPPLAQLIAPLLDDPSRGLPGAALLDLVNATVWVCDAMGRARWRNVHARHALEHVEPAVLASGEWAPVGAEGDVARWEGAWAEALARGAPLDLVVRLRAGEGEQRWNRCRAVPVRDGEGGVLAWVVTATDVHDERETAERLSLAIESRREGVWDWHVPSGRLHLGALWFELLGYEPDALPAHVSSWERLVHPDDAPRVMAALQAHMAGECAGYEAELRLRGADGAWRWVHDRGRIVERDAAGAPVRIVGSITDISARHLAEARLAESEARFRSLSSFAPMGIVLCDAQGNVEYANPRMQRITGRGEGELLGQGWLRTIAPDDRMRVVAAFHQAATRDEEFAMAYRVVSGDGTLRWVQGRAVAARDAQGAPRGMVGIIEDIDERVRADEALRATTSRLETLVRTAPAAIVATDAARRVAVWNAGAERLLGIAAARALGAPLPPQLADIVTGARDGEVTFVRDDGVPVDLAVASAPIAGEGSGHVAFLTDVRAHKRTEEGFREFVQRSTEAVMCIELAEPVPLALPAEAQLVLLQVTGTVASCNQAMARLHGLDDPHALVGTPLHQLRPLSDRRNNEALLRVVRGGYNVTGVELWDVGPNGEARCFRNTVVGVIERERVRRLWITQQDVTAEKAWEIELVQARDAADDARRRAEEANRAKSEFLAVMSHELRTPLNSVIGFAQILRRNREQVLDAKDLEYLGRIHGNGRHLLGLINDVLDLSKIEAGHMEVEWSVVAVDELVEGVLAQLGGEVAGRPLRLVVDMPGRLLPLRTDAGKLRQVLINLVGNAIKFTAEGTVQVRVVAGPTGVPTAIEVVDTGIGIAADRLATIFEPFEQGERGITRRFGGTGLGLSISRSLCALMGATLSVSSVEGTGSTFRIALS